MDMSTRFPHEVHIIEAPMHAGFFLDSIVLFNREGIKIRVDSVYEGITNENFTSEVHCTLVPS